MTNTRWITCDGGPHLLLPAELEGVWCGTDVPSDGRTVDAKFRWTADADSPASDYDAACDVADLVGLLRVGDHHALVLGDEVPMSTWLPSEKFSGGVLVVPMEWPGPLDHQGVLAGLVALVDSQQYEATGLTLPLPSGACRLIAASDAGRDWLYPTFPIGVPAGSYAILSAEVRAGGFWLRLHALQDVLLQADA